MEIWVEEKRQEGLCEKVALQKREQGIGLTQASGGKDLRQRVSNH
jgi:hypothetical protein